MSSVVCLGRDANGEHGGGSHILTKAAPIESVGAGLFHSFAISKAGELWTWGAGSGGQLGQPRGEHTTFGESSSAYVGQPSRVRCGTGGEKVLNAAASRNHTLAVTEVGTLFTWGRAASGQLGHGEATGAGATRRIQDADLPEPKQVQPVGAAAKLPRFASVSAGEHWSVALTNGGVAYTWGSEYNGQLGRQARPDYAEPRPLSRNLFAGELVATISCGWHHALAGTQSGRLYSWGCGAAGQLGRGSRKDCPSPALVEALGRERIVKIAAGRAHSLAAASSGLTFAFGDNAHGQCGLGKCERPQHAGDGEAGPVGASYVGEFTLRPQALTTLLDAAPVAHLSAGAAHSTFVTENGRLLACGDNSYGQIGNGLGAANEPRGVNLHHKVLSAACGAWHTVLLLSSEPAEPDPTAEEPEPPVAVPPHQVVVAAAAPAPVAPPAMPMASAEAPVSQALSFALHQTDIVIDDPLSPVTIE